MIVGPWALFLSLETATAALIGEGSANYGIDLAFPDDEKIAYERDVLFPRAGLDPELATTLDHLNTLKRKLAHSQVATAQLFLDGDITREEAIEQRRRYGLSSRERAEQSVRFIEQYRSYVLNYSLGQDIVRDYIERLAPHASLEIGNVSNYYYEAFAALPEGTVEGLLEDIPALTDVLLYHVVPGQVMAADVVELDSAETVQGTTLSISSSNSSRCGFNRWPPPPSQ